MSTEDITNKIRVVVIEFKIDVFIDVSKDEWYTITVADFYKLVEEQLPPSHKEGSLFISHRGKEKILSENSLLSEYDILNIEAVLIMKPKPRLINVFFHKQFYIDNDTTIKEVIPLIHYAFSRHDWIDENNQLFSADKNASHISLPTDIEKLPETLQEDQFKKLQDFDHINEQSNSPSETYFLYDDSKPLLACEPSPISEFQRKGPKQKR